MKHVTSRAVGPDKSALESEHIPSNRRQEAFVLLPLRMQGDRMSTREASRKSIGAGDMAPDFTLPSLDGEDISLSDYRGKRVILFMWASW